jgi:hypothetical protein
VNQVCDTGLCPLEREKPCSYPKKKLFIKKIQKKILLNFLSNFSARGVPRAAMVHKAPLKIYARGVVSYFYFSRAPRARALKIRQINSAILKVPDGAWSC